MTAITTFTIDLPEQQPMLFAYDAGLLFLVRSGVRSLLARCSNLAIAKELALEHARLRSNVSTDPSATAKDAA